MTDRRRRAVALAYGVACHLVFAAGVAAMIANLYGGMRWGLGPFRGWASLAANLALVLQFPVVHSFLLTRPGRKILGLLAPRSLASDLQTTLFALVATVQLVAVFVLWSPSGVVWWTPGGPWPVATTFLFVLSWVVLGKALWDAGLAVQSGALGWRAVYRGVRPDYGSMPTRGLFRFVRQPVYVGFALILWAGPVWTPDHLALALLWTVYCVVGPRHKERRSERIHGDAFRSYRGRVPCMAPSWSRPRKQRPQNA